MHTYIKLLIAFVILSCTISSCENYATKIIEFEELGFEPRMVMNCEISSSSDSIFISVSKNINYANASISSFDKIDGVNLTLTIGGDLEYTAQPVVFQEFSGRELFNYLIILNGEELSGKSFRFEGKHPDYPDISSEIYLPASSSWKDVTYREKAKIGSDFGYTVEYDAMDFTIIDNPDEENYYYFQARTGLGFDTTYYEIEPGVVDTIIYQIDDNPLASNSDDISAVNVNNYRVLFSDKDFNGQEKKMTIYFENYFSSNSNIYMEYRNISKADFLFIQSYALYQNSQDFGIFSEPTTLYSNIEGGLGLFSAQDIFKIQH